MFMLWRSLMNRVHARLLLEYLISKRSLDYNPQQSLDISLHLILIIPRQSIMDHLHLKTKINSFTVSKYRLASQAVLEITVYKELKSSAQNATFAYSSIAFICFLMNSNAEKKMEFTIHDRPIETPKPRYIRLLKN
jgi:hypothetical protein